MDTESSQYQLQPRHTCVATLHSSDSNRFCRSLLAMSYLPRAVYIALAFAQAQPFPPRDARTGRGAISVFDVRGSVSPAPGTGPSSAAHHRTPIQGEVRICAQLALSIQDGIITYSCNHACVRFMLPIHAACGQVLLEDGENSDRRICGPCWIEDEREERQVGRQDTRQSIGETVDGTLMLGMPQMTGKGSREISGEKIGKQNSTGRPKSTKPARKKRSPTRTDLIRTSMVGERPGLERLATGVENEGGSLELESEECVIPRSKKRRGRVGAANYSKAEINALLDFVHEVEPVGSHHWGNVHARMAAWAADNDHTEPDIESLKNKFDKLSNTKKSSGDPD